MCKYGEHAGEVQVSLTHIPHAAIGDNWFQVTWKVYECTNCIRPALYKFGFDSPEWTEDKISAWDKIITCAWNGVDRKYQWKPETTESGQHWVLNMEVGGLPDATLENACQKRDLFLFFVQKVDSIVQTAAAEKTSTIFILSAMCSESNGQQLLPCLTPFHFEQKGSLKRQDRETLLQSVPCQFQSIAMSFLCTELEREETKLISRVKDPVNVHKIFSFCFAFGNRNVLHLWNWQRMGETDPPKKPLQKYGAKRVLFTRNRNQIKRQKKKK